MMTHPQSQEMLPGGDLSGMWREKRISRQREQDRKARRISHVSRGRTEFCLSCFKSSASVSSLHGEKQQELTERAYYVCLCV